MKCENCKQEHDSSYGSGRFCSNSCSNSYSRKQYIKSTKIVKCIVCKKEIEVDNRASDKLCKCDSCRICKKRNKIKPQKISRYCVVCGNVIKRNSKYCCSQKCNIIYKYNNYIERWKNGFETGLKGKESISGHIKRYLFNKYNNKCCECGWNKINPHTNKIPLQVDHIDGNYKNNKEENLRLICPSCHSLTSTYGGANRGNGRIGGYKHPLIKNK